jgi:vitamin B12 transporter
MFRATLLIFALFIAPTLSSAQAAGDSTIELPAAVVEAVRTAESASSPTRLSVIGPAELDALPIRSVADALDRRTSIYVVRYGSSGQSTASIRGAGGKHTAVFLDGMLLSDPQSNQIDLAVIPVVMLESIEITHGPGSAARGSGSLGGSVALNTIKSQEQARLKLDLDAGEFGRRRVGMAGAAKAGDLSLTVAGEVSESEGDYPYSNPTLIDPVEQTRDGADKSSTSLYGNATYNRGKHRVSASTWINSVERGLPGPANAPPADARQWDDHARVWIKSDHRLAGWIAELGILAHRSDLRYSNPATATDELTTTTTTEIQAAASRVIGASLFATAGIKGGIDRSGDVSEQRLAAFAEATYESGRAALYPSARLETWVTDEKSSPFFAPRLGLNLRLSESDAIHAKANFGRTYRVPSFLERYWIPGGNPDLLAEDGWSIDSSIHAKQTSSSQVEGEAGVFYTNLENKIAWFPSLVGSGVQVWRPLNVGRVVSYGTEVSADSRTHIGISVIDIGFSATVSRSVDRTDESTPSYGKQLRYTPQFTGTLYAGVTVSKWTLNVSGRHVGQRYITSDERASMDAHTVFDGQMSFRTDIGPTDGLFALQVENVFNAQYSVMRFYPMPPRTVTIRVGIDI